MEQRSINNSITLSLNQTGLLAVSAGEETITNIAKKTESSPVNADDIVMLEIDVKDPVKRSPVTGNAVYGGSSSQFVVRHGDDSQEVHAILLGTKQ
jgi:hypothetical protein